VIVCGIDPGLSGAIVIVDHETFDVRDMPCVGATSGKGWRVSPSGLLLVLECRGIEHAYVEQATAMPKQGVTSTFRFGYGAGVVEGVLAALRIPYTMVNSASWKRRAGLIGKDKDASRALAMRLWPVAAPMLGRKRDHGRAEALLLTRFGESNG
jgi:crossover junction endodeoxyribonuclease RuvC